MDVLALKLGDELVEALGVSLNTDGLEDSLDVGSGGAGVATEAEEEVGSEVLHFCGCCEMSAIAEASNAKTAARVVEPQQDRRLTCGGVWRRTSESIDLAALAETETSSPKRLSLGVEEEAECARAE